MITVRAATLADVSEMVAMGRGMHAESPRFRSAPYCEHKAAAVTRALIASEDGAVLVAEYNGDLVGMVLGMVSEHFFSTAKYACDFVVYVRKSFRSSKAAMKLLREWEKFLDDKGVTDRQLGISTEVQAGRTKALYEHLGYRLSGYIMVKNDV